MKDAYTFKFSLLYFIYSWTIAILTTTITLVYSHMGHTSQQIGVALSITTAVAFFSQFILGYLCDAIKNNKRVFLFGLVITLGISVFFFKDGSPVPMFVFAACLGLFYAPMTTILDVWVLKSVKAESKYDFAFIRSWCALGAGIFSYAYCWALEKLGFGIALWAILFTMLVTIILAINIKYKPLTISNEHEGTNEKISARSLIFLLENRNYMLMILNYAFLSIAISAEIMMLPLRIKLTGGATSISGICIFILMVSQWAMLLLYKKLQSKVNVGMLFMAGNLVYMVYYVCQAMAVTPLMIAIFTIGNGISYGIYFPSLRQILFDVSPQEVKTFAQSVSDAIGLGVCGSIGGLIGGTFVNYAAGRYLMLICAAFSAIAFIFAIIYKVSLRKNTAQIEL